MFIGLNQKVYNRFRRLQKIHILVTNNVDNKRKPIDNELKKWRNAKNSSAIASEVVPKNDSLNWNKTSTIDQKKYDLWPKIKAKPEKNFRLNYDRKVKVIVDFDDKRIDIESIGSKRQTIVFNQRTEEKAFDLNPNSTGSVDMIAVDVSQRLNISNPKKSLKRQRNISISV